MQPIDSPQNQHVKLFRALAEARGRSQHGLMQIEGVRLLEAALDAGQRPPWAAICPGRLKGARARALLRRLQALGVPILPMTARAFDAMSDTAAPAGIAAVCAIPHADLVDLSPEGSWSALVMLGVQDPGNVGTMIRTADAFGCGAVVAVQGCADFFAPKVVRATAGSVFHLPLVTATWDKLRDWATASGIALIATAAEGGLPLPQANFPERRALIVGSEAHGLPDAVLTAADLVVTIPTPGRAESLNAAIAAGILLHWITNSDDGEK